MLPQQHFLVPADVLVQNTNLKIMEWAQCPLQAPACTGLSPSRDTLRQTLSGLLLGTVCLLCLSPTSKLSWAGPLLVTLIPSVGVFSKVEGSCLGLVASKASSTLSCQLCCSLVLFTGRVKFEKGIPIFIHSFNPQILKHQPQNTGQKANFPLAVNQDCCGQS